MKPETRFRDQLMPLLKKIPHSNWFTIQQMAICGTPDILGVVNGRFIGLECKVGQTSPRTKLQEYNIDLINKCGGFATFIHYDNMEEVVNKLMQFGTGQRLEVLSEYIVKAFKNKSGRYLRQK
jgi:hypothetical protein